MSVPGSVLRAYELDSASSSITPIPSLINQTYVVHNAGTAGPPILVLQRLHPVFGPHVHLDIEAATAHLAARQLETPRLVHTRGGELWTVDTSQKEPRVWRALTYVDGVTVHRSPDARWLQAAAALLGRFHNALTDFEHTFVHVRPIHDTPRHFSSLAVALASERALGDRESRDLGGEILRQAEGVRADFSALPERTLHGDPKLSNVMFHQGSPPRARCLIDLDTLGRGPLGHELGDALRSWCNPAGEDVAQPVIDAGLFEAVLTAYAGSCPRSVNEEELWSALDGVETISLELASRFAADAMLDTYFGWDNTRFATRREHNLVRARGQLSLSRSVRDQRAELSKLLKRISRERVVR